jgi:hypothetical protein
MGVAIKIWREVISILRKHPKIFIPFIILGVLNAFMLYLLYLTPQRPVAYILAPPIRVFFGERFLHYPFNLFILPKLFNYAKIALGGLLGMLMSAWAISIVSNVVKANKASLLINFKKSIKRYFSLLAVWSLAFILVSLVTKFFKPQNGSKIIFTFIYFFLVISIQILFIYIIPLLIIERRKLFSALKENLFVLKKLFMPTIALVLFPTIIYLPILIARAKTELLVNKFFPEIILIILAVGIAVSFIIDLVITISTTILFLKNSQGR